jgi:MFS superfamily sulfate permease-like transporter
MTIRKAAVFSNWLGIQSALRKIELSSHFTVDVSQCKVVDHTVMENLHNLERDFTNNGGSLTVTGADNMVLSSKHHHPLSARKR